MYHVYVYTSVSRGVWHPRGPRYLAGFARAFARLAEGFGLALSASELRLWRTTAGDYTVAFQVQPVTELLAVQQVLWSLHQVPLAPRSRGRAWVSGGF